MTYDCFFSFQEISLGSVDESVHIAGYDTSTPVLERGFFPAFFGDNCDVQPSPVYALPPGVTTQSKPPIQLIPLVQGTATEPDPDESI